MKRQWIILMITLLLMMAPMTQGYCEVAYGPTFFDSDKEALEVLQSLKGSFWGWSNFPKQTVEIDKYGLRLFSEYMGTKKVWNVWDMYYMTVPDLRSENATLVFKDVSALHIDRINVASASNQWVVTADYSPAATFCVKDETTARRFADAVATLATASGAKWVIDGGYTIPSNEKWYRNKLKWKQNTGAIIKTVLPGGLFNRAGIHDEDILLTFGGQEVINSLALWKLQQALSTIQDFEIKVPATINRGGATLEKEITFYNYNAKAGSIRKLIDQPASSVPQASEKPKLGANVRSLTDDDIKTFNLPSTAGVLVIGVVNNSTAQMMNLLVNDIILEINGIILRNSDHLREILSASTNITKLKIRRGDAAIELIAPLSI